MSNSLYKRCHDIFFYDDGKLYRKSSRRKHKSGESVGSIGSEGYLETKIDSKRMDVHRIVFLMFNGYLPDLIDHADGVRTNNRIENLRSADFFTNAHNSTVRKDNASGVKGVHYHVKSGKWIGSVSSYKKRYHAGCFDSIDEAENAVIILRKKLHGDFSCDFRPRCSAHERALIAASTAGGTDA